VGKIRVLLADDHTVLLAALRMLIEAESDMIVVAEAINGDDPVEQARRADPDVAVVNLTLARATGFQVVQRLRRLRPRIRILALTMNDDPASGRVILDSGVDGYVAKRAPAVELLTGIRTVHRGRPFLNGKTAAAAQVEGPPARSVRGRGVRVLSKREREVLDLLARGHSNREVADRLRVGVKTIETYRARLRAKLGVKTRAELVRYATSHEIL
jgi:DNA-binding NarL/FixJ family response regulator